MTVACVVIEWLRSKDWPPWKSTVMPLPSIKKNVLGTPDVHTKLPATKAPKIVRPKPLPLPVVVVAPEGVLELKANDAVTLKLSVKKILGRRPCNEIERNAIANAVKIKAGKNSRCYCRCNRVGRVLWLLSKTDVAAPVSTSKCIPTAAAGVTVNAAIPIVAAANAANPETPLMALAPRYGSGPQATHSPPRRQQSILPYAAAREYPRI